SRCVQGSKRAGRPVLRLSELAKLALASESAKRAQAAVLRRWKQVCRRQSGALVRGPNSGFGTRRIGVRRSGEEKKKGRICIRPTHTSMSDSGAALASQQKLTMPAYTSRWFQIVPITGDNRGVEGPAWRHLVILV